MSISHIGIRQTIFELACQIDRIIILAAACSKIGFDLQNDCVPEISLAIYYIVDETMQPEPSCVSDALAHFIIHHIQS